MQNDNLSASFCQGSAPGAAVDRVARRGVVNGGEGRSLITPHISPQTIEPPLTLRSTAAKTGVYVDRFVWDDSGADAYSGNVVVPSPADSVEAVYTPKFDGHIEVWEGAHVITAKRPPRHRLSVDTGKRRGGGRRGAVAGFSRGSRRRLQLLLGKVRTRDNLPSFLTVTYPGHVGQSYDWMTDPKVWKRHLDNFIKRLRRQFPSSGLIWKLEPQKRGAPHFHMFVWGCNHYHLAAWAVRAWFEVVGSGHPYHLAQGTNCEMLDSWRKVANYASKYLAKRVTPEDGFDPQIWDFPGRWWGMSGGDFIPWGRCVRYIIPRREAIILIRTMRKFIGKKARGRDFSSLSVLVWDADYWLKSLPALIHSRGGV